MRIRHRIFFPTSRLTQEKERSSTDELPTRFAVEFFLSYELLMSRKQRIFFLRRAKYKGTYVEAVESARAGLLPKKRGTWERKEKDQERWSVATRRGCAKEEKEKTKEGGLSPQEGDVRKKKKKRPRKARRWWIHKGKVPCVLNQEFLFLVHEYLGLEAARLVWSISSYET